MGNNNSKSSNDNCDKCNNCELIEIRVEKEAPKNSNIEKIPKIIIIGFIITFAVFIGFITGISNIYDRYNSLNNNNMMKCDINMNEKIINYYSETKNSKYCVQHNGNILCFTEKAVKYYAKHEKQMILFNGEFSWNNNTCHSSVSFMIPYDEKSLYNPYINTFECYHTRKECVFERNRKGEINGKIIDAKIDYGNATNGNEAKRIIGILGVLMVIGGIFSFTALVVCIGLCFVIGCSQSYNYEHFVDYDENNEFNNNNDYDNERLW